MIHEIGQEVLAHFNVRGVPFPVIDGPEFRKTATFARERVVIEHDPETEDGFAPRHRADINPRTWLTRNIVVQITIYAKHPNKGAIYWEHKRRAEQVLDQVLVALSVVAKKRGNLVAFKSGKFIYADDLKESETPGGAIYRLKFTFDRGVADRNWDLSSDPIATISAQMVGGPSVTFDGNAHTIIRVNGSFISDGFNVGDVVIVSGTALNNGTLSAIVTLTDTVMTFSSGLVNEIAGAAIITGNGVVVANTTQAQGTTEDGGASTENA